MINLHWADAEKTLLLWQFGHRWTRNDFLNACYTAQHMMCAIDHPVNVLVDLSITQIYPKNLVYLALTGMRMHTPNLNKTVVVSSSQLWSRLYQYIQRVYPRDSVPVEFVYSYHDAMQTLNTPFFIEAYPTFANMPVVAI